jgi:hypothetical protein
VDEYFKIDIYREEVSNWTFAGFDFRFAKRQTPDTSERCRTSPAKSMPSFADSAGFSLGEYTITQQGD